MTGGMQWQVQGNLGAPLLGGGFVTGRREKLCSYGISIARDSRQPRDRTGAILRHSVRAAAIYSGTPTLSASFGPKYPQGEIARFGQLGGKKPPFLGGWSQKHAGRLHHLGQNHRRIDARRG